MLGSGLLKNYSQQTAKLWSGCLAKQKASAPHALQGWMQE